MTNPPDDMDLLFGLFALQRNLISREQLVLAMQAQDRGRDEPLRLLLVGQGALTPARRDLLDQLVAEHVRNHGGDVRRSLSVVSTVTPVPAIPGPGDGPDGSGPSPVISATSRMGWRLDPHSTPPGENGRLGHRFRILRPLASGGLGQVSVARDEEVGREVALKEILPGYADHGEARSRFLLEAEINGRLEHPGIVPVYGLGAYEDGRPFYAMRFIQGQSLRDAVSSFHDEADRLDPSDRALRLRGLIGRLIDVCNAVAYAHSKGVLHRDLTPRNIMLGEFGETLIIDWGLAKATGADAAGPDGAADHATPLLVASPDDGRAATLSGATLGTPGYLSPEAAEGRVRQMGPATDVYSLGALLFTILTGKAPLSGTVYEILRRTIAGEIPSPRSIAPATPPALEAIVRKAMALRPEDRYAGPRALADDLRRFLADEPIPHYREPWSERARRWAKRHRTLATSTAAALLVAALGLAGFAAVLDGKNRELDGKNLALDRTNNELKDRNRELDGKNLALDRVNGELKDRNQELDGKNAALDRVNGELAARNRELDESNATLDRVNGELKARNRDLVAANEATRAAEILADARLDKAMKAIHDYYSGFTTFEGSEGLPKDQQERLLARPREFYEELTRELAAKKNPSRRELELLAVGRWDLASVLLHLDRGPDSIRESEAAIGLFKRLVAVDPDNPGYREKLGGTYSVLATALGRKDLDAATRAGREQLAVFLSLVKEDPKNGELRHSLATSWANLANYLRPTDTAAALEANRTALALTKALADENPDREEDQQSLAHAEHHLAVTLIERGERAEAETLMRRAIDRLVRLARARPKDRDRRYRLAMSEYALGDIVLDPKDSQGRQKALRSAIARLEVLIAEQPRRFIYRAKLAACLAKDGEILIAEGNDPVARDTMAKAVAVLEPLVETLPDEAFYRANLARDYELLGHTRMTCKDPEGAREAWTKSLAMYDALIRQAPNEREYADHRSAVASVMAMDGGNAKTAEVEYNQMVARLTAQVAANPGDRGRRAQLAALHFHRGNQLEKRAEKDPIQAAARQVAFGNARKLLETLVAEAPENAEHASALGATLNNMATFDLAKGRNQQARAALDRAVPLQEKALASEPANLMYRTYLENHLNNLINVCEKLGDKGAREKAMRRLYALKQSDPRLSDLDKRVYAVLVGAVPSGNAERLELAGRALKMALPAAAVGLWAKAFEDDPAATFSTGQDLRLLAARAAAAAAAGLGTDQPRPDAAARDRFREQARTWLADDLEMIKTVVDGKPDTEDRTITNFLAGWRKYEEFAAVRDAAALGKLPRAQRDAWLALWADLDATIAGLRQRSPKQPGRR